MDQVGISSVMRRVNGQRWRRGISRLCSGESEREEPGECAPVGRSGRIISGSGPPPRASTRSGPATARPAPSLRDLPRPIHHSLELLPAKGQCASKGGPLHQQCHENHGEGEAEQFFLPRFCHGNSPMVGLGFDRFAPSIWEQAVIGGKPRAGERSSHDRGPRLTELGVPAALPWV